MSYMEAITLAKIMANSEEITKKRIRLFATLKAGVDTEELLALLEPYVEFSTLSVRRTHISKRQQRMVEVRLRDGDNCYLCGVQLTFQSNSIHQACLDHKVPKSKGGPGEIWNLGLTCRRCNSLKSNMSIEEFHTKYPDIGKHD